MSAHRTLNDLFRAFDTVGPGRLNDPGDAGTITFTRWGQQCLVTTAAAETRTLARPTKPGILASVVLDTDAGDLTLTVTGGYNADADTSITFADAGDMVVFLSVKTGTTYQWTAIAQEGTNVAIETAEFDALIAGSIAGGDNSLGITGQAQATTVDGGTVVIAGAASIAGATGAGGAVSMTGGASGSTAGAGGAASVAGGLGTTTGAGGAASLTGGIGGSSTGNGGAAAVAGGAAPGSNANGGAASLTGGATTAGAAGTGGAATVAGGANANTTNGAGGLASVTGGAGKGTGDGGAASLVGGAAGATGNGGAVAVTGGASTAGATGTGGAVAIAGGANANTTDGAGGAASLTGGAGKGTGVGGTTSVAGGASAGSGAGGDVILTGGSSGSGIGGSIYLRPATDQPLMTYMLAPVADSTTATDMTEAILLSGVHAKDPAGALNYQVPTGTEISAAVGPNLAVGDSFLFTLINTGNVANEDITLTVDTGVTFVGSVILAPAADDPPQASSATWRVRNTGANTWIFYRL